MESRTHAHFCEQEWWDDMDVVLAEAEKRGMKVWTLDAKHFPTGYANGLAEKKYPERRKWQLLEEHVDVVGPAPQSAMLLRSVSLKAERSAGCSAVKESTNDDDQLLGVYRLSPYGNRQRSHPVSRGGRIGRARLHADAEACGEATLLLFGDDSWKMFEEKAEPARTERLNATWTLSKKAAHNTPCDEQPQTISELYNITGPKGDPTFSGWMRYETEWTAGANAMELDLGLVGECAHVWLNGVDLGERIAAPYRYDISKVVREGVNQLTVEVTNSLVYQQPDYFSRYMQLSPSGLLGPVEVCF